MNDQWIILTNMMFQCSIRQIFYSYRALTQVANIVLIYQQKYRLIMISRKSAIMIASIAAVIISATTILSIISQRSAGSLVNGTQAPAGSNMTKGSNMTVTSNTTSNNTLLTLKNGNTSGEPSPSFIHHPYHRH